MSRYDVLVVGAGPGGYVAAIRARQLGLSVGLIERAHLGGICLNWGCLPTKTMLKGTDVLRDANMAERFGLAPLSAAIDPERLVGRSKEVSTQLSAGVAFLLKKNGVDLIWGAARLEGGGAVTVSDSGVSGPRGALGAGRYEADHIILATGAKPRVIPGLEPDGNLVWTYMEALRPTSVPASLIVVGSGAIGLEFASIYAAMGTQVTVVELAPQILPNEDAELADLMSKAMQKRGIKIMTGVSVTSLQRNGNVVATLSDGQTLTADRLLSAVGVVPNAAGLGLEELGVEMSAGGIKTTGAGRTSVQGIYAIGDIAGPPMLAHKASHDGIACVEAIARGETHAAHSPIPSCIYAHPQLASVGMTEAQAIAAGHKVKVGRFSMRGNGKALVLNEPDGLIKCVFDAEKDTLLGAQVIGAEASELIHGLTIAVTLGATAAQLKSVVFPHPTLSEALHEAVLAAGEGAIHA